MATLSKKDLGGMFGILAVVLLFDGFGSGIPGLPTLGVIFFVILAALIWYSMQPSGMHILAKGMNANAELVVRAALVIMLIGVLLFQYVIIFISLLVGEALLFMQFDTLTVDVWSMTVSVSGGTSTKKKG